jgi:hypothetical protein
MSRFFGTASDSDTESDVSEEEVQQRPTAVPTYTVSLPFQPKLLHLFLKYFISSSAMMKKNRKELFAQLKKRDLKN